MCAWSSPRRRTRLSATTRQRYVGRSRLFIARCGQGMCTCCVPASVGSIVDEAGLGVLMRLCLSPCTSCGVSCVQVIYSPNAPIHGGAARVGLPPGNGSGHVGLKPDAEAMNTDQAEGGVVRRLYGWLG